MVTAPVLVVDDDADCRVMLATLLECAGFPVATAQDGRAALAECRRQRPCLILLDLMMPVMTGEAFRTEQLRDPLLAEIPVVIVSARHDAAQTARRLAAVGCNGKPIDADALLHVVGEYCHVA
jgi:CheY-like chemotaxis protein